MTSVLDSGSNDRLTQKWANDLCAQADAESEVVRALVLADDPGVVWPRTMVSVQVGDIPGEYGVMMPAWPVVMDGLHQVQCLTNWGAYLDVLGEVYAPHSDKAAVILSSRQGRRDRIAVGVMNDVLQVQMPSVDAQKYNMIRHHAVMLLAATEWLPTDRRAVWREAYGELANVMFGPTEISLAPWQEVIEEVEARGLSALKALARADDCTQNKQAMMQYLLMAGAAVGLLYRKIDMARWTWREAIVPLARIYRSEQCFLD